jgi:spore coat protein U-like protein
LIKLQTNFGNGAETNLPIRLPFAAGIGFSRDFIAFARKGSHVMHFSILTGRRKAGLLAGVVLFLGFASPAWAATTTTNFTVSATVVAACLASASNISFGNYTASSSTADNANGTVTVTCTNNDAYTIALNGGGSGHVAARTMANGSNTLGYGVYTTSGYATIWGDGTNGTQTVGGTGNGAAQNYTAYGQIPVSEYSAAGSYTDTLTATVTF